jgi:hypothetical protein
MESGERIVVTCQDAAKKLLRDFAFRLEPEEYTDCQRKLNDQSGHDTPDEKMRFSSTNFFRSYPIAERGPHGATHPHHPALDLHTESDHVDCIEGRSDMAASPSGS